LTGADGFLYSCRSVRKKAVGRRTMWIDGGVVVVVLVYTVMGLFQGVVVQLFRLAGLVLVVLYARFVADSVGHWIALHLEMNPLAAYYVSFVVGSLLVYAVCALTGRWVHRRVTGDGGTPREANRVLGAVLGLAKGVLVAFLLLSIVDMVPVSLLGRWTWFRAQAGRSRVLPQVRPANPLPEVRFLADVDDYKKVYENPEAQRILQRQRAFIELLNLPRFREAVNDEGLRELVKERRWPEVFVNEKVLALVFDREVRGKLNELNPRAALEEAEKLRPKKR
jgi:membrane protein required for colicin V production